MGKFSSQEIESQYNLIKMLLAEPEKYKDAIYAISFFIAFMASLYFSGSAKSIFIKLY